MSLMELQQGIAAIQAGSREDGARLLRIALRSPQITGSLRATALTWLAETTGDRQQKLDYYNEALAADPTNADVQQRLAHLLQPPTVQLPPQPGGQSSVSTSTQPMAPVQYPAPQTQYPPPPGYGQQYGAQPAAQGYPAHQPYPHAQPQPPVYTPTPTPQPMQPYATGQGQPPPVSYRFAGVFGGEGGPGTGVFITLDGILATSRYVVGGREQVTVELEPGKQVAGRVVRSFTEMDLAFVSTGLVIGQLFPITPLPYVLDNQPMTAFSYNAAPVHGAQRPTRRALAPYWIPTTIERGPDTGGAPLLDERQYLLGILTRNASRTSNHLFGLHVNAILRALEVYVQEMRGDPTRVYCPSCGSLSRSPSIRGFYCDFCGAILPYARETRRFAMPQADVLYGEAGTPCPTCGSRAGHHHNRCLRCGSGIKF